MLEYKFKSVEPNQAVVLDEAGGSKLLEHKTGYKEFVVNEAQFTAAGQARELEFGCATIVFMLKGNATVEWASQ